MVSPVKLEKMYKNEKKESWRCEIEGTLYRTWWDCKKVKAYWEMIYNELKKMLKITFLKKLEAFLLGILGQDIRKEKRTLFMYATTAARMLIAQNWKTGEIPSKEQWQEKLMNYEGRDSIRQGLLPPALPHSLLLNVYCIVLCTVACHCFIDYSLDIIVTVEWISV
ncbi:Hypothetical predicted protein [Podarcis lilfordi]|uniref:Uncharacterized protein n=1 Tax=Podarcis lilfordi TaxID=74358 RepID=A0AA35K0K7_9SAUR|nr:Hypothetical predicted protein [Podarcis lilfordi]